MKLKKIGKKGAMLLYIATLALIIALFAFLTITLMQRPAKGETRYIGEHQIAMLKASMRAEKSLFYVDQAAKLAVPTSIIQLAEIGGVYSSFEEPSECGDYYGYNSWQSSTEKGFKVCYPKNIESSMKRLTESMLSDLFGIYDSKELRDYAIDYYMNIDKGKVEGIASNQLEFDIVTSVEKEIEPEEAVPAPAPEKYEEAKAPSEDAEIVPIPPINGESVCLKTAENCELKKAAADTIPTIYKLFEENGCRFRITSSYRTEEQYAENWYGEGTRKYPDESARRAWYCGPKDGSFKHCPHYTGLAIDFDTIGSGCGYEKRIQLMCQAGWVNYHNERWHFEYKTSKWQNAMANGICQWPPVATESDDRGEFRAGHAAIKNDFITPEIIADIPPSTPIITPNADDNEIITKTNQYSDLIDKYSGKYGVPPKIVKAMIAHESHGDPNAISYTGCVGLGQFCYDTATGNEYKDIFGKDEVKSCNCGPKQNACKDYHECTPDNDNRFDPDKNIEATAKYLSKSYKDYDGNIYLISISFNAGEGVADKIKEDLGNAPRTYENIRPLLDNAVLKYDFGPDKIKEADKHMKGVAHYYQLLGGQADQQTFSTVVDGKEKTYLIDVIGEYSVYPSFSVETGYSFDEYKTIINQIKGYAENDGMNELVIDCRKSGKDEGECVAEAIEEINTRESMRLAGLKMFNGPCDPKENLWSDFVEDFGDCIENEQDNCYCEITLDQAEQSDFSENMRIKAEKDGQSTNIILDNKEKQLSYYFNKGVDKSGVFDVGKRNSIYYVTKQARKISIGDKMPNMGKCGFEKRKYKLCVLSPKQVYYYDASKKESEKRNVEYKFAIEFPDLIPPPAVENLKAFDKEKAESSVIIEWDVPKKDGVVVPDLSYYLIYCSPTEFVKDGQGHPIVEGIKQPQHIYARELDRMVEHKKVQNSWCGDSPLKERQEYYFAVVPFDSSGNNGPARSISAVSVDDLAPGPVKMNVNGKSFNIEGETMASGQTTVILWDTPKNNEDGLTASDDIKKYHVYLSEDVIDLGACNPSQCKEVENTKLSMSFDKLNSDITYRFAVIAVDSDDNHIKSIEGFKEPNQWKDLKTLECYKIGEDQIECKKEAVLIK